MKIYDIKLSFSLVREDATVKNLCEPYQVADYIRDAFSANPEQESVWVILLDTRGKPKGRQMITLGTATASLAHPREVFRAAVMSSAAAIIIAHNHPSGNPTPSFADDNLTQQIKSSGRILGIDLLDHIIIGTKEDDPAGLGHYSYRLAGKV